MIERHYFTQFCPYCGTKIVSPITYCEKCGAKITWSIHEAQTSPWPWTPKSTYIITIITYALSLLLTIALMLYYVVFYGIPLLDIIELSVSDPFFTFILTLGEVVFFLVPWAFVNGLRIKPKKVGVTSGGTLTFSKDIILGIGVGALMVPLILLLDLYEILNQSSSVPQVFPGPVDLFWIGMLCLSIIFVVAPAEEFLFRGFVQSSLDAHYGRIGGLLVASIIFGMVHLNPLIGVLHTIGGIVLGLLFLWRNQRLASPIAAHATYDVLLILLDAFLI
ncbi:MAG: CPBP family intramembrane glutamic endopeptidase [Candidatus Thorarchaeota archaeon]